MPPTMLDAEATKVDEQSVEVIEPSAMTLAGAGHTQFPQGRDTLMVPSFLGRQ